MDSASNDYTRIYADTFVMPEQEGGVYLLDRADDVGMYSPQCESRNTGRNAHVYERDAHVREGYYTGGNIISSNRGRQSVYGVAWDERPLHYNPNSGSEWAHLVPSPMQRPYGGGPAPSLAYPMISTSEAQVGAKDFFTGAPPPNGDPTNGSGSNWMRGAELTLQVIKVVLLLIIVVMLAMTLAAASDLKRRIKHGLKKTAKIAAAGYATQVK